MIIGQFCDVFPPELDGVGTVVKNYARYLCEGGDLAYFIAPRQEDPVGERPFPLLLFRGFRLPGEPYRVGMPSLDLDFRRTVNGMQFDVVHAHSPFGAGHAARRVARRQGIPLVATFHSKYYDDFLAKTHSEALARLATRYVVSFYNTCDEVWAVNDATAEVLRSYGYGGRMRVMPNGTDPWVPAGTADEVIARCFPQGEGPLFMFCGQHHWKKNIKTVLEAVALYAKSAPCRLLMVGQGPDRDAIVQKAEELGISSFTHFYGHTANREELMQLYAAADLFLFPSLYDNAPMVVREAAAAGTPSVLVRASCAAEGTEDGVNAFHCEDSPESLAAVMAAALPHVREVGERARTDIPKAWPDIIAAARTRYCELIEEKKAKTAK